MINLKKNDAIADAVKDILQQESLKGNQHLIDKNKNNKVDPEDFRILRGEKKTVKEEEVEAVEENAFDYKSPRQPEPNGGSGVKKGSRYGGSKQKEKPEQEEPKEKMTLKKMKERYEEPIIDELINEVLSKDADAGDYIHDFVHSDNPNFAGKSKTERKKQALAAYYAKKNEEYVEEGMLKNATKKAFKALTGGSDEDQRKALQRKMGVPQTGKKPTQKEEVEIVYEANIEPTSAKSRSHVSNLSNPTVNGVTHQGKQIGLITKQPSGEYHAHHSSAKLAHAKSGTFDTKDKAHQFIRNAHADAIKKGTLKTSKMSESHLSNEEVESIDEDKYDRMLSSMLKGKSGKRLLKKHSDEVKKTKDIESGKTLNKLVKKNPGVLKTYSAAVKRDKKIYGEEVVTEAKGPTSQMDEPFVTNAENKPLNNAKELASRTLKRMKSEMLGKAGTSE